MELLNQLASFLADPPGNLIYILVTSVMLMGALQGAISLWRASGYPQARRMVLGLSLVLTSQVLLLLVGLLMSQGAWGDLALLPVLDRAAMLFSLIWLIWVWAYPEPNRSGDAASALLSLLTLAALLFGAVSYAGNAAGEFNQSAQSAFWSIGAMALSALGLIVLLARKSHGWGTGVTFVFMALLGFSLELFAPRTGDFLGFVRFFMLAGYPLALTLPMRFPMPSEFPQTRTVATFQDKVAEAQKQSGGERPTQPLRERRRYSTDPKTLQSLLLLAAETEADRINQAISRAIAQAMLADLCFLLYLDPSKTNITIAAGYDLIREENLQGGMMHKELVPMLGNAIMRGRALRLPASTTSSDLKGLGDMLGLSSAGNLLNVPILSEKDGAIGSLLLLSPYSNRVWSADDQTFLINITASFVPIMERGRKIEQVALERDQYRHASADALAQLERLQDANTDLSNQVETFKARLEEASASVAERQQLLEKISALQEQNQQIITAEAPVRDDNYLENELRLTLREMARLQNSLAESNIKILELESKQSLPSLSGDQADVVVSISQELRQPLSSVIGYADLLLGESVGILGALQRKFIERIRASTERIGSLIDDLIQLTTLESGLKSLKAEPVDLNLIIDNAMAYTSSQLREKKISLRIDIPENITSIHTDREALQQILIHLLQNAGAASAVESAITLRVRTQRETGSDYALIQVADSGGGIPAEDMNRVFSRLYRADNVLIQGVGDTGVGLSIARTLTEAQGGRIWVDTEMGTGSTFSVLLPMRGRQAQEA